MIVNTKPTPSKLRMAVILQSRYDHPCFFCNDTKTVAVDTIDLAGQEQTRKKGFIVRHKCARHRLFGYWTNAETAWGWD